MRKPDVWDYPNITRPFSIIYYALGGCAYYSIDGKERPFQKVHLYILPANKVFSLREDARDKFYSVYIHAFTSPEIDSVIDIDVSKDSFIKQTLELVRVYARDNNEIYIRKLTDMLYFSSPENLSRFFKSCYGYSPTEYKKRFKDISV